MSSLFRQRIVSVALGFLALATLSFPLLTHAGDIPASEVRVKTPVYQPSDKYNLPLGTYTYEVSWQGIPAAEATVTLGKEPGMYRMNATARTYSGIDIIYKLRYDADGLLSDKDLTPIRSVLNKKENRKIRLVSISYLDTGEILTVREKRDKGEEEPPEVTSFKPDNFMLEPFSAALIARSLDWEPGVSREFDTFNGKSRYLITLTCAERTTIDFNGVKRDVYVVIPKVKNLTSPDSNGKLREAKMYVSADDRHEVLQIISEVFIGAVKMKLESFRPSPASPVQVANKEHGKKILF